jgi:hypothetical protein
MYLHSLGRVPATVCQLKSQQCHLLLLQWTPQRVVEQSRLLVVSGSANLSSAYCQTYDVQDMRAAMEQVLAFSREVAGLSQQLEQMCQQAFRADERHKQIQRVLMEEARAVQLGRRIPHEVAEARRRTVAAAAAAAAGQAVS